MSAIESDTVESFSLPSIKDPIERLNNFDLRLLALSQDLNDSLVCIACHHDANKAQFDSITTSVSYLNSIDVGQLTQRQSALERQTQAINKKIDLLLKYLGKHKIDEYVDETVRKHVGSTHIGGSSHFGGSTQSDELTNGLHDNLGKMNLGSNSIIQPYTRLPATGDLQFNLGDQFRRANVNFPLYYQPSKQNYPPNQVREVVALQ